MKKTKLFLFLIIVLSLIGIADAIHLLEIKLGGHQGVFCDISTKFNCSGVNHSEYAEFLGVPVAVLGLAGYVFLGIMAGLLLNRDSLRKKLFYKRLFGFVTPFTLWLLAAIGFVFQLYLTIVEAYVLDQYCIFCLASQLLIFLILIFAWFEFRTSGR